MRLGYPVGFWFLAPFIAFLGLFEATRKLAFLGTIMWPVMVPVIRHKFLHPLGRADRAYYKWLVTTPYQPGMPLPNGSVMPGLRDLLFFLTLLAPVVTLSRGYPWPFLQSFILGTGCVLQFVTIGFAYVLVRELLNTGPRWIAYTLIALVLMMLRADFIMLHHPHILWYMSVLIPVVVLAVAVAGLHLQMQRYPWPGTPDSGKPLIANYTLHELIYNYTDPMKIGQPFTTLRPNARWPRVPIADTIWASLLVALLVACLDFGESFAFYLFCAGGVFFVGRINIYGRSKNGWLWLRVLRADLQHGRAKDNLLLSLIILATLTALGMWVVESGPFSATFDRIFVPLYAALLTFAGIKLPPSRERWETVGRWRLVMTVIPPTQRARTLEDAQSKD